MLKRNTARVWVGRINRRLTDRHGVATRDLPRPHARGMGEQPRAPRRLRPRRQGCCPARAHELARRRVGRIAVPMSVFTIFAVNQAAANTIARLAVQAYLRKKRSSSP